MRLNPYLISAVVFVVIGAFVMGQQTRAASTAPGSLGRYQLVKSGDGPAGAFLVDTTTGRAWRTVLSIEHNDVFWKQIWLEQEFRRIHSSSESK